MLELDPDRLRDLARDRPSCEVLDAVVRDQLHEVPCRHQGCLDWLSAVELFGRQRTGQREFVDLAIELLNTASSVPAPRTSLAAPGVVITRVEVDDELAAWTGRRAVTVSAIVADDHVTLGDWQAALRVAAADAESPLVRRRPAALGRLGRPARTLYWGWLEGARRYSDSRIAKEWADRVHEWLDGVVPAENDSGRAAWEEWRDEPASEGKDPELGLPDADTVRYHLSRLAFALRPAGRRRRRRHEAARSIG